MNSMEIDERTAARLDACGVTREVGRRVSIGGVTAWVMKRAPRCGCGDCVFWVSPAGRLGRCQWDGHMPEELGECEAGLRDDGQAVIFADRATYEAWRAAQQKKREEDRAWKEFEKRFSNTRLGKEAKREARHTKDAPAKCNKQQKR